jgi:DNA-binding phage protein
VDDPGLARVRTVLGGLYKALSGDQSPRFAAILKVISVLGFKLSASLKESASIEGVAEVA